MNDTGPISLNSIDINILHKVPIDICKKYKLLPIGKYQGKIYVAMEEIKGEYIRYLEQNLSSSVVPIKVDEENISKLIKDSFGVSIHNGTKDTEDNILDEGIEQNASDIHFEPFENDVHVRYRLNGSLNLKYKIRKQEYAGLMSRIKIKSNMDIAVRFKAQDGKMIYDYKGETYDLRTASIPTYYGEKVVIRIMYNNREHKDLESLSFSKEDLKTLDKIIALNRGMILVNGATGSGKSTTLYSILKRESLKDLNVMTIEDPVEVLIKGINQVNVSKGEKGDVTFHSGLRNILRQDPDIIMIGEIRDEETAKIAIRASITGHKVYSTIHTRDVYEVFRRLKEMGVEEYLIIDSIIAVISQKLIKKLCPNCREEIIISEEEGREYNLEERRFYRKKGCRYCNYTGYSGRVLIYDLLLMNEEKKKMVRKYLSGEMDSIENKEYIKKALKYLKDGIIDFESFCSFVDGENL